MNMSCRAMRYTARLILPRITRVSVPTFPNLDRAIKFVGRL